jgi:hypothetical protein
MKYYLFLLMVLLVPRLGATDPVLSIKNYRQLYSSMSVVTGVPKTNPIVSDYFQKSFRRLSETGQVGSVSAPLLLTSTVLASRFCDQFILSESKLPESQRKAHAGIDFTKGPASLNSNTKIAVLDNYGRLFWGRSPDATERDVGLKAFEESSARLANVPDTLLKSLKVVCSNYLGSLEFLKQGVKR